jgi:pimeloyl-ACP methyl ester carboxylesterase
VSPASITGERSPLQGSTLAGHRPGDSICDYQESHSTMSRFVYLHGFASGPASRKASFFRERLAAGGLTLETPDLSEGNFRALSLTAQLRAIERLDGQQQSLILIGSSMGGYLAALYAAAHPERVERLVLLAPAFNFYARWVEALGPENLTRWREQGEMPVYHYGTQHQEAIGYQLIDDARQYAAFPNVSRPVLIFHGTRDTVVPLTYSEEFVRKHPSSARLVALESGHELTDVLGSIWAQSASFLREGRPRIE